MVSAYEQQLRQAAQAGATGRPTLARILARKRSSVSERSLKLGASTQGGHWHKRGYPRTRYIHTPTAGLTPPSPHTPHPTLARPGRLHQRLDARTVAHQHGHGRFRLGRRDAGARPIAPGIAHRLPRPQPRPRACGSPTLGSGH
jgi:hypothetical protein